jgi:hypothetical protein
LRPNNADAIGALQFAFSNGLIETYQVMRPVGPDADSAWAWVYLKRVVAYADGARTQRRSELARTQGR